MHGLNDASDDDAVLDAGGGGSPAVADRTSRTFLSKNSAKLSAMWSVLPATSRSRPSSGDSERHSIDDERPHWLSRPSQYSSYFARFRRSRQRAASTQRRRSSAHVYVGSGVRDADSDGVQRDIRRRTRVSDVQDDDG